MAFLGKTFLLLGSLTFVLAVGWWYLYFEQFHGAEVKEASDCFYYFEPTCTPSARAPSSSRSSWQSALRSTR
jgi:hypothetical protein